MATASGAFSSYPSLLSLRVECYEISTNIANNTSVVRADAYIDFSGGSATSYNNTVNLNINGSGGSWNIGTQSYSGAGARLVVAGFDITVPHNADGSKTTSFSGSASTGGWGSASCSNNLGLTNFDFTAGTPGTMTATPTVGVPGRVDLTWGASTSYVTPITYYYSYRSSSDGGVNYGSWSGESTTTNTYASYTSLTPGITYQFRVRAYNGQDNYSGYRESNTAFLVAGGKRYAGPNPVTDWALTAAQAKRWNGSAFVSLATLKKWDGTNWVNLS